MYAYKQVDIKSQQMYVRQKRRRNLSVVSQKKVITKRKPKSFIGRFLSIILSLIFGYYVFPTCYNGLINQVFNPSNLKITSQTVDYSLMNIEKNMSNLDLYSYANPTTNYLSNDMFNNRLLMTPVIKKSTNDMSTMYQTSEIVPLKSQLNSLINQYPKLTPAIYAWEYEHGKYIDINGDNLYSAASIIKIPVLVRLFKSIEAGQMTIFDEMLLTDFYQASGSGNLQYAQTGRKYTLDQLAKTMIHDSDNTATNMLMAKMGGMDDVNIGLRNWGLSKTYVRTWLPDLTGTNKTTAKDISTILYNLDNPAFLNVNSREYIIDYMSHVKNNRLIAAGLGEGALFVHKTGDIGTMLGDAGIVYAPNGKKYIVTILVNRPYNSPEGKDFIVKASNLIYKSIVD